MFGDNFFPFDAHPEQITNGHEYHFGAHWSASVTATTTGDYGYTLTSDDDSWVYVDGHLTVNNPGVHAALTKTGTTHLTAGTHHVEIFFAERHVVSSNMSFQFTNGNLTIKSSVPNCPQNQ